MVTVEVWATASTGTDVARLLPVLDPAERARADAMPPSAQVGFVRARALLRAVVGARLGVPAGAVGLQARCPGCGGPHGPIEVEGPPTDGPGLHVSATRSGPVLAVVLSATGPVGIDVESHARVARAPVADVALSDAERRSLARLPLDRRSAELTRAWVRKEAALKAWRTGLRMDPATVDVRAALAHASDPGGTGDLLAHVVDLRLGRTVVGAIAVSVAAGSVRASRPGAVDVVLHDGGAVLEVVAATAR